MPNPDPGTPGQDTPNPFVRREPADPATPAGGFPCERVWMLTRDAAREVDRVAVEEFGVPSVVLMENAAVAIAREAASLMVQAGGRTVLIVCGPGNNGGDGLAAARHLHNAGAGVRVALAADRGACTGDARTNLAIVERMGVELIDVSGGELEGAAGDPPTLVIDALFGTGLTREIAGPMRGLVEGINALRARGALVLAVDLPSGLNADSGEALGVCVRADATVTLAGIKPGVTALAAHEHVGEVIVGDIGCPVAVLERLGTPIEPPPGLDP